MTERLVTIPLRKGWLKKTRIKRTPRAIREIRGWVERHLKTRDVWISPRINEKLWDSGIKKPPARIRVKVVLEEGKARVLLPEE